jgi:hypothetical protein
MHLFIDHCNDNPIVLDKEFELKDQAEKGKEYTCVQSPVLVANVSIRFL